MATMVEPSTIEQALSRFRAVGFTRLRGFLSAEMIDALRQEADRLEDRKDRPDDAKRSLVRESAPRPDRIEPVIDVSPVFAALVYDLRMLKLAGTFLQGEAQLLKDKFIGKPPGAIGYGAHQDLAYWQEVGVTGENAMTIVVCIDRCTAENGAMEFAPDKHHALLTTPGIVADLDEDQLGAFATVEAEAGDLLLFSSLAPHRSGPNTSGEMRRTLFITYVHDPRPDMYAWYLLKRRAFFE